MSEPSLAIQAAIVAALKNAAAVTAIADERVYDKVPAGAQFPYVHYGEDQVQADDYDSDDCLSKGFEVFVTLHVWSRANGKVECKRLGAAVHQAIDNADLTVNGFTVFAFEHQSTNYLTDPDGLTTHGVCQFRVLLDPA
jgi:hypothetical protein